MPGSGMQALMITETNPSMHNWKVGEVKRPAVKNGHVIVRVKATAINPADWKYATVRIIIVYTSCLLLTRGCVFISLK